jgi:WD40 repeat protein
MRRACAVLVCLTLAPWAPADDKPVKPLLVLDAGGHTGEVRKVRFTPDGKELLTVSDDKTIRVWDVAGGETVRVLRPPAGPGEDGMLYALAVSPDGKLLAVGGNGPLGKDAPVFLITRATGRLERVLPGHGKTVRDLAFSPDGKRLASGGGDGKARLWNVASGACEHILEGHKLTVHGVAFAPDGQRLATASLDKTTRLWNVATGNPEATLEGRGGPVYGVAWSPDGRTLATGNEDRVVTVWNADGTLRKQLDKLENLILSVTFTPDGRELLCTCGGNGNLRGAAFVDVATGKERSQFPRHHGSVKDGALSPDGKLAATVDVLGEVYLWKAADVGLVYRLTGKGRVVRGVGWSKDGKALGWGYANQGKMLQGENPLERSFRVSDLEFGDTPDAAFRRNQFTLGSLTLEKTHPRAVAVKQGEQLLQELKVRDTGLVNCFTWLGGDRVAIGSGLGVHLFDPRTGKLLRDYEGHTGAVLAVAPSPDNRFLLTGADDQTLRLWTPDEAEPLLSLFFAGDDWVAWTPQGYYAASPGGEHLMGWHVPGTQDVGRFYPAARFRNGFYRPDVIQRLLATGSVARALEEADKARNQATTQLTVSEALPPQVSIVSPERSPFEAPGEEIEVKAVAKGSERRPVTALRLLFDGRPYEGQVGTRQLKVEGPNKPQGEVRTSWKVKLTPGKHRLAVQAENAVSKAVSDEIEVTYNENRSERPALYVLAIGISKYPGDLELKYAAKDARDLEALWKAQKGKLYRNIEIKVLTDKDATREGILGGFDWLKKQMTQRDVAVISFSGHGARDNDGTFYLAPVDVKPSSLAATGVPGDQLKKTLAGIPGRILLLLDACHAGAVDGDKRRALGGLTDDLVRDLATDDFGVIVMCSSMGREYSLESDKDKQGMFTRALLEGLGGKADYNGDGVVYLSELDTYITDRVKELSEGKQHPVTAKPASIRSFPLSRP